MLFRALCCLCSHRQSLYRRGESPRHRYEEVYCGYSDDDDSDDDDEADRLELSRLKREAIDAAVDVSSAERLLARYGGNDSSLLMYHHKCHSKMIRALGKLPPHGRGDRSENSLGKPRSPSGRGVPRYVHVA